MHTTVVDAFAAAEIGGLLVAFHRKRRHEVLHALQVVAEFLIDKRAVGEAEEGAFGMRLAELDQVVFAHQGLAARVDVHVGAQLFALADDVVDVFVGEVETVTVVGRPAALAVQVAGARGVEQDGPRDVAVVLLAQFLLLVPTLDAGIIQEVGDQVVHFVGVALLQDAHEHLVDVRVGVAHRLFDGVHLRGEGAVGERVGDVHQTRQRLFRIGMQNLQGGTNTEIGDLLFHGVPLVYTIL